LGRLRTGQRCSLFFLTTHSLQPLPPLASITRLRYLEPPVWYPSPSCFCRYR
jgi:hypothetical protein